MTSLYRKAEVAKLLKPSEGVWNLGSMQFVTLLTYVGKYLKMTLPGEYLERKFSWGVISPLTTVK